MRKNFRELFSRRVKAFCAFCKSERRIYRKRRLGVFDLLGCGLAATTLMALVFQEVDARVLFFFVMFLAVTEMTVQLRWRLGVVCPHCGFDPLLYLKSPEKAADKVRAHLEKRREDPATLFAQPLNLPKRAAPAPEKPPARLSRHV